MVSRKKFSNSKKKQARLDSALAWGSAIADMDIEKPNYELSESKSNFCSNCGTELKLKGKFCSNCGVQIQEKINLIDQSQKVEKSRLRKKSVKFLIFIISLILVFFIFSKFQMRDNSTPTDYSESSPVIDTNSREYITGLTIGNNFSSASDANAVAEDVCTTARDKRVVINSRGYQGVDPKTATFLMTDEGFQGCVDGFNGVPQD